MTLAPAESDPTGVASVPRRLTDRRVLVTGAASGIGRGIARRFASEGAQLALLDRDAPGLSSIAQELDAIGVQADLADPASVTAGVRSAAGSMGGLDGIVNCAGISSRLSFADTDYETWRRFMAINLDGAYLVAHAALPWLTSAEREATIVTIASGQALLPGAASIAYAASKGGVLTFTKALAMEFAPRVRANVVCPGPINTEMATNQFVGPDAESKRSAFLARYPLGRLGEIDEIAAACVFLTSRESSYVTGATLAVDGGRSLH